MTEESDLFVKEITRLLNKVETRAKSFFEAEGKDSKTGKELHQHAHSIRETIKEWKDG